MTTRNPAGVALVFAPATPEAGTSDAAAPRDKGAAPTEEGQTSENMPRVDD